MRPTLFRVRLAVYCAAVPLTCFAQQPSGPPTLEDLLGKEDATPTSKQPRADRDKAGEASERSAARPEGTLVRPKDGVEHPDLDTAWAAYDAAVAKATESIKLAITKQFDVAAASGDLDAAEKWQAIGEKFQTVGNLPVEKETTMAVNTTNAELTEARKKLAMAYEAVVKHLTMEKDISAAKRARAESAIVLPTKTEKDAGEIKDCVFLSDLEEQNVRVTAGWGWRFGKNGDLGTGRADQIVVRSVAAKKGLSMHPATRGVSSVTYNVPEGCVRFEAKAAIDDSSRGQQSPVVFEVIAGEKVLWRSRPLQGAGVSDVCAIRLKDCKTIVLRATCVGPNGGAHAVWVDPCFLRK